MLIFGISVDVTLHQCRKFVYICGKIEIYIWLLKFGTLRLVA